MKAKSIRGGSAEEIDSALQQSMADGFRPTLAIVFISIKQEAIQLYIKHSLPIYRHSPELIFKVI